MESEVAVGPELDRLVCEACGVEPVRSWWQLCSPDGVIVRSGQGTREEQEDCKRRGGAGAMRPSRRTGRRGWRCRGSGAGGNGWWSGGEGGQEDEAASMAGVRVAVGRR